jgi:putative transposase
MDRESLRFYNPFEHVAKSANRLPHWQQPGRTYFLTIRLADSIPAKLRAQWEQERDIWLSHHPEPWTAGVQKEYHKRFSAKMDAWLDAGHGSCVLRKPECRAFVEATLRHSDEVLYWHHAWVIMPNHAHMLTSLHVDSDLKEIMKSWKGSSTHPINKLVGRRGTLWQIDYFDRLIRDGDHFANCVRYIRRNPSKAKLRKGEFTHHETELARKFAPVED